MSQGIETTGIVLMAVPSGDYDRRLVLLTRERGKITAFARGARRPKSMLQAATVPFTFGKFTLYEGQNAYTFASAEVKQYFPELKTDYEAATYGNYFCELASYYGRENLDAAQMLNLLYLSLLALTRESLPNVLVRSVYEIRLMVINGEFPVEEVLSDTSLSTSTLYALNYIITAPLEKLYTFVLTEDTLKQIRRVCRKTLRETIDIPIKSLPVLELIVGSGKGEI